jgi:hypothetical protein
MGCGARAWSIRNRGSGANVLVPERSRERWARDVAGERSGARFALKNAGRSGRYINRAPLRNGAAWL